MFVQVLAEALGRGYTDIIRAWEVKEDSQLNFNVKLCFSGISLAQKLQDRLSQVSGDQTKPGKSMAEQEKMYIDFNTRYIGCPKK